MSKQGSGVHAHLSEAVDQPAFWEPSRAFFNVTIVFIVAGAAVFATVLLVCHPDQTKRALNELLLVSVAGVAWFFHRRGRIEAAVRTLALGAWGFITVTSFFFGGVSGTAIIGYPLTFLLIGWMISTRAAVAVALLTIVITFLFLLGESWGFLPVPPPTPPAARWFVQCVVFMLTATLILQLVRSYRGRLIEVRKLSDELAQRTAEIQVRDADLNRAQSVARVGSWVYELASDSMQLSAETCLIFGVPVGTTGSSKSYLACVHPEDGSAVAMAWEEALRGGQPFEHEHRIMIGRRIRWVRQRAELELDANGHPLRAVGTTQDITRRKRAEVKLRESESQLQCILGSTADGILAVGRNGKVIQTNQRFAEMWHIPQPLLAGKDDQALLNHVAAQLADPQAFLERVQSLYASDTMTTDNVKFKDGRVFERFTSPLILNHAIVGRVWSFRNITERTQAEAARVQLEAQLRESQKMEALGTLAGGIAHDFNNALAAVMGNVELARQDVGIGHPAQQSLDEIAKAGTRAKALVQQILAFGRRQLLERKRIALAPVLEESMRLLRATQPAGVKLSLECAANVPPVMADAAQIEQVLVNLCTNAWHAIEDQARQGEVEIRLNTFVHTPGMARDGQTNFSYGNLQAGRYACLSVRDNGAGMDEETLRRIFEPFFTTKPVGKGTGLGLAVVHGILQEHEACIEIESRKGQGATFRIYIPAAGAAAPDLQVTGLPVSESGAAPQGQGKHILYVDDDEALVLLITRLLQRQGYRVSGCTDPAQALAAVRADPMQFDLVVTDYNMPGTTGLMVVQALKDIRPDLPVAMASGYITDDLRTEALAAGVRELIYKPDTVEDLCAAVARLVNA